ncbi:MAG: hypothetical protein ABIG71_02690 [Candidatus Uhrbacteria bacterium]
MSKQTRNYQMKISGIVVHIAIILGATPSMAQVQDQLEQYPYEEIGQIDSALVVPDLPEFVLDALIIRRNACATTELCAGAIRGWGTGLYRNAPFTFIVADALITDYGTIEFSFALRDVDTQYLKVLSTEKLTSTVEATEEKQFAHAQYLELYREVIGEGSLAALGKWHYIQKANLQKIVVQLNELPLFHDVGLRWYNTHYGDHVHRDITKSIPKDITTSDAITAVLTELLEKRTALDLIDFQLECNIEPDGEIGAKTKSCIRRAAQTIAEARASHGLDKGIRVDW